MNKFWRFAAAFVVNSHHVKLHMMIAQHAGSRLLREMIDRSHVLILNWLFDVTGRRTALPVGFHARLADALVSGDSEKADAAMRAHVRYGLSEISGQIRELAASEWRERPAARRRKETDIARNFQ
jgi:DNA-binding GntR family transcriptional regulator